MSSFFQKKGRVNLKKIKKLITTTTFLKNTLFVILVFILFLTNTSHESYPDEFDNILGGLYILQGKLPYIGFFTHHGPVPYFISAIIVFFSGKSFVIFRIIYAILLASFTLWSYTALKKRLGAKETAFYPVFILAFGLFATYYWGHMLLADNMSALFFVPVYTLFIIKLFYNKLFVLNDFLFISVLSSLALYSSLSYAYLYLVIIGLTLFQYMRQYSLNLKIISKALLKPIAIILMPHVVFLVYLIITGSLSDYIYQNFKFNTEFYVYNYPRAEGTTFINPIRFAIVIANNFFNSFHTLLLGIKDFNFAFPVNITMAIANVSVIIYSLSKRRYALSLFIFLVLIYSNVRSSVLDSKETDYQSAVYIFISFINLFFVLRSFYAELNDRIDNGKRIIYALLFGILGIYSIFCLLFLVRRFNEKVYTKYMGDAPLIYDRPRIAPLINLVTDKNDYAWIGPFEFEELFYMDAKIPSKHHILIKGVGVSDKLRSAMNDDFEKNMPKIIYFDRNFFYLGSKTETYSQEFISFLNKNYITVKKYSEAGKTYHSVDEVDLKTDLEKKLFIRKDKAREVIQILIKNNYLREDGT